MSRLDMDIRDELAERVDSDIKRGERETGVDFFDIDDRFTITSYSPSIVRKLLRHDEARIRWIYATGGAEPTGRVRNPSRLVGDDAVVEGLQATLPKGSLSIKGVPRSENKDSNIVKTPRGAEDAREAFTDGGRYVLPATGGRVEDRENGDELVVVAIHPDTTASDYKIEAIDATVAAVNGEYDPDAPVVEAVYAEEVEATLDAWRSVEDLRDAVEFGAINSYSFPADRLASISGGVGL